MFSSKGHKVELSSTYVSWLAPAMPLSTKVNFCSLSVATFKNNEKRDRYRYKSALYALPFNLLYRVYQLVIILTTVSISTTVSTFF